MVSLQHLVQGGVCGGIVSKLVDLVQERLKERRIKLDVLCSLVVVLKFKMDFYIPCIKLKRTYIRANANQGPGA